MGTGDCSTHHDAHEITAPGDSPRDGGPDDFFGGVIAAGNTIGGIKHKNRSDRGQGSPSGFSHHCYLLV